MGEEDTIVLTAEDMNQILKEGEGIEEEKQEEEDDESN